MAAALTGSLRTSLFTVNPCLGRRSSDGALSRLHHRRTMVPVCPISSPRWPRRPFIRTKASTKRQNVIPTPSASNEGQVFKGGGSLAADGEQHTDRAARAEGRRERYRWPPDHQVRRSECYRLTRIDELPHDLRACHSRCSARLLLLHFSAALARAECPHPSIARRKMWAMAAAVARARTAVRRFRAGGPVRGRVHASGRARSRLVSRRATRGMAQASPRRAGPRVRRPIVRPGRRTVERAEVAAAFRLHARRATRRIVYSRFRLTVGVCQSVRC